MTHKTPQVFETCGVFTYLCAYHDKSVHRMAYACVCFLGNGS